MKEKQFLFVKQALMLKHPRDFSIFPNHEEDRWRDVDIEYFKKLFRVFRRT
jgi:hypothetical protein